MISDKIKWPPPSPGLSINLNLTFDQNVVHRAIGVDLGHRDRQVAGGQRVGVRLVRAGLILDAAASRFGSDANVVSEKQKKYLLLTIAKPISI